MKNTKKANHRFARKRAVRMKHPINDTYPYATHDSIRACRRGYGLGKSA